jgi:hypothetical protein
MRTFLATGGVGFVGSQLLNSWQCELTAGAVGQSQHRAPGEFGALRRRFGVP